MKFAAIMVSDSPFTEYQETIAHEIAKSLACSTFCACLWFANLTAYGVLSTELANVLRNA